MDPFEYSAPQFIERLNETAVNLDNDGADIFFDIPDSSSFTDGKENIFLTPKNKPELKEKFFTPMIHDVQSSSQALTDITNEDMNDRVKLKPKRRSDGKSNQKKTFDGIKLDKEPPEKGHAMLTRQDVALNSPKFQLRNRVVTKEALKRKGSPIKNKQDYHSLAEKVFRFHNDTPPRFKSTRPSNAVIDRSKLSVTVAHSPRLLTKARTRVRPSIAPIIEQPQIKANPVNKNVFKVPTLNKPLPRPSTVPEPFNLTQIKTKSKDIKDKSEEPFQFKAKPAPKKSIVRRSISSNSICSTRSFSNNGNMLGGVKDINRQQQSIKVKPFSFEERNKQQQLQKEEKIKKMLQEQIQVPVFHAKPAPSYLTRTVKNTKPKETKGK